MSSLNLQNTKLKSKVCITSAGRVDDELGEEGIQLIVLHEGLFVQSQLF